MAEREKWDSDEITDQLVRGAKLACGGDTDRSTRLLNRARKHLERLAKAKQRGEIDVPDAPEFLSPDNSDTEQVEADVQRSSHTSEYDVHGGFRFSGRVKAASIVIVAAGTAAAFAYAVKTLFDLLSKL